MGQPGDIDGSSPPPALSLPPVSPLISGSFHALKRKFRRPKTDRQLPTYLLHLFMNIFITYISKSSGCTRGRLRKWQLKTTVIQCDKPTLGVSTRSNTDSYIFLDTAQGHKRLLSLPPLLSTCTYTRFSKIGADGGGSYVIHEHGSPGTPVTATTLNCRWYFCVVSPAAIAVTALTRLQPYPLRKLMVANSSTDGYMLCVLCPYRTVAVVNGNGH